MAASARQGERATSFAMACSLLSRYVRQNGAAAAELGLGINKGEPGVFRDLGASLEPAAYFILFYFWLWGGCSSDSWEKVSVLWG